MTDVDTSKRQISDQVAFGKLVREPATDTVRGVGRIDLLLLSELPDRLRPQRAVQMDMQLGLGNSRSSRSTVKDRALSASVKRMWDSGTT